jgi:hypothetical protein
VRFDVYDFSMILWLVSLTQGVPSGVVSRCIVHMEMTNQDSLLATELRMPCRRNWDRLQGELSVNRSIRALEESLTAANAGPAIRIVDGKNINTLFIKDSFAPASFKPTFRVE